MLVRKLSLLVIPMLVAVAAAAAPPRKDVCPAPTDSQERLAAAQRGCEYFGETFASLGLHSAFGPDGSVITCLHFSCRPVAEKPDLTVKLTGIDNDEIRYGAQPWTWVHYEVRNSGPADVSEPAVYLRVIKNGVPSTGYMKVEGPIAAGGSKTSRFAVGHDSVWPPGKYEIQMEVDYRAEIDEVDEGNNLSNRLRFVVR